MAIAWKDAAVSKALDAVREKPDGPAIIEEIGSEYLVASILDANDFNVDKGLDALRQTLEWRKNTGVIEYRKRIQSEKLEPKDFPFMDVLSKHLPMCEGGKAVDKRGLGYGIVCLGCIDFLKFDEFLPDADWLVVQFYISEYRLLILEENARREGILTGVTVIHDLFSPAGLLSIWNKNWRRIIPRTKVLDQIDLHYPNMIGTVHLAHAPWAVEAILTLLRPFLPKRVSQKILVYPTNKISKLREYFAPESLPKFLGGDGEDADFVANRPNTKEIASGTELVVGARAKDERGLWLSKGDVASYGFSINGGFDIMLSCTFTADGETTVIRPPFRVDADSGGNSFQAPSRGRLVLVFDNTYSWVNPKTLRYEFSVLAAADAATDDATAAVPEVSAADKKGGYEAAAVPEALPVSS